MSNSDITRCKSLTLYALKCLVALTLTLPPLMLLAASILVGALGSLTGQPGIELAIAFLGKATITITIVSLQLMLAVYCISIIHSILSRECWMLAYPLHLALRLYTKITRLVRLWASLASATVLPLYLNHTSHRRIADWKFADGLPVPYLAGEAPQLE